MMMMMSKTPSFFCRKSKSRPKAEKRRVSANRWSCGRSQASWKHGFCRCMDWWCQRDLYWVATTRLEVSIAQYWRPEKQISFAIKIVRLASKNIGCCVTFDDRLLMMTCGFQSPIALSWLNVEQFSGKELRYTVILRQNQGLKKEDEASSAIVHRDLFGLDVLLFQCLSLRVNYKRPSWSWKYNHLCSVPLHFFGRVLLCNQLLYEKEVCATQGLSVSGHHLLSRFCLQQLCSQV